MGYVNKSQWPDDMRGFGIGRLAYLVGIMENRSGSYYVEFDTARDVTVDYSRAVVDTNCWRRTPGVVEAISDGMKESIMGRGELTVSAELLFDLYDSASVSLMNAALYGNYFRIGAFTEHGWGPWFWTFASKVSRSEPLDDILKISVEFPCARFLYWYDSCYTTANGVPTGLIKNHPLVIGKAVTQLPQNILPVVNKKRKTLK